MTTDRPYRLALSKKDALQELQKKQGSYFDPLIVAALKDISVQGLI